MIYLDNYCTDFMFPVIIVYEKYSDFHLQYCLS